MAIRIICGFEQGTTAEAVSSSGTSSIVSSGQRTGTYALRVNPTTTGAGLLVLGGISASNGNHVTQAMGADLRVGFAFKAATLPASGEEVIGRFSGTGGAIVCSLRITSAGILKLYRTSGGILIATGTTPLSAGTWYYIEWLATVGTTVPYEVRINGTTEFSGNDTQNATPADMFGISLGKVVDVSGQSVDFYYDDVYLDDAAFQATSAIPEVRRIGPNGAGSATGWTNGTGTTFAEVDEIPPESDGTDATYAGASATEDNTSMLFALESCATAGITGTILAVQLDSWLRTASVSGTSGVSARMQSNGTAQDSPSVELTTSYVSKRSIAETDFGNGGIAWTSANVDALEAGARANTLAQAQRMTSTSVCVLARVAVPITPPGVALVTALFAPVIKHTINAASPTALVTSAFAPAVREGVLVTPTTKAATLATFAPTVSTPRLATPPTAALTATTFAPTVSAPRLAIPAASALSTALFAPTVRLHKIATPGAASLSLATFAPAVSAPRTVTPATAGLTVATFAPSVSAGVRATPTTAALAITAFAPTVVNPKSATPATLALALTTFAPGVTAGAGVTIVPGAASLVLATFAPPVTVSNHQRATPITAALALTTFEPVMGGSVSVVPATAALAATRNAPTVSTPRTVTPLPAALALASLAPLLVLPQRATPVTAALVLAAFAPAVGYEPVTVTPGAAALVLAGLAPDIFAVAIAYRMGVRSGVSATVAVTSGAAEVT